MLYLMSTYVFFVLSYSFSGEVKYRRFLYYFVLIGLFIFSGFRYQVGCDWWGYYYQFLQADERGWIGRDPIWWAVLGQIRSLSLPYPVVNTISSFVFFLGVHVLAKRQPDPFGFLVLLFPILVVNMAMSAGRQSAAIGILCVAFCSFIDRRPVRFSVYVVLAAGFHSSAIIFLSFLVVLGQKISLLRMVGSLFVLVPGVLLVSYSESAEVASFRYIGTDIEAAGALFRVGLIGLSGLYFFLFVRKRWAALYPEDYRFATIGSIGMMALVLILPLSSVIADRFGYYFVLFQTMIFSRLPFMNFRFQSKAHSVLPYFLLALVFTVWVSFSRHFEECYIPYQNWILGFPELNPSVF